jgi:hypothetical protein
VDGRLVVFTALPLCFSEIVKPGPTVPASFGGDMGAAGDVASSATAPAATSVQMSLMECRYETRRGLVFA